jgi:hypothetical protein
MAPLSRRGFFKSGALAAVGGLARSAPAADRRTDRTGTPSLWRDHAPDASLSWLEGAPALFTGTTFGVPWPRGLLHEDQPFAVQADGGSIPCQSWPTAYWPDGSLKWTAHALPAGAAPSGRLAVKAAPPARLPVGGTVRVEQKPDAIVVDTGVIACTIPRKGPEIIRSLARGGRVHARAGRLVVLSDDQPDAGAGAVRQTRFDSETATVTLEQEGPVRSVVRIEGKHRSRSGREWLPFSLRLYFYAGAESVRIMHTFVFDGDEQKDFLRGIGLAFDVPLPDPLHDRHVRFGGEDGGLWAEGVRNVTGLRRDPGAAVRAAQLAGQACPPMQKNVADLLHLVPAWGDVSLSQLSSDSFRIRKRTKAGCGWVDSAWGRRAPGLGYVGGATGGGIAFGLRDFWQRHPTQLDIREAHTDTARVTLWMWSPDAPAMDLRFYHDGMGMDTHAKELQGLDITYEDYERGFGTPVGVARSSEITLWALESTPARERLVQMAALVQAPPQLAPTPEHILATRVFGDLWSLPDRSTPAKAALEDQLDARFDFYKGQVDQRRWYGFWDYGDIRHTYDADRHDWRYDVGGFAWDNSELSPDLWLWYSFLRSGRADVFRMAEAMVRHTSEVDTYHMGRFAGLGSRHNVQHWGCSAKQVRISTAVYRRAYYYLTADERVGDILRELLEADKKLDAVDPFRKLANAPSKGPWPARIGFGTDWASLAADWLTEWERSGSTHYRDKILTGMRDIAAMPHGFFNANRMGYEPDSGHLHNMIGDGAEGQHLNAVFGAVEIFDELIRLTGDKAFEAAWLDYCELFNAPDEEQRARLGKPHGANKVLYVGHSRLTAYAAARRKDPVLARRAWKEFAGLDGHPRRFAATHVAGPAVLRPVDEVAWNSTNDTAQWALATIQNLALVGDALPRT